MHSHFNNKNGIDSKDKQIVVLLGNPNVGKSVIFGLLTGKYVAVSNYPGTTVEVTRGASMFDKGKTLIIDTPGTNSLIPNSEDERVARDIIFKENLHNLIQVADAKNLRRALFISLQLAEAEIPYILVLNMDDEAKSRGIITDQAALSRILGVEVIPTIATQKKGIKTLIKSISKRQFSHYKLKYDEKIEKTLKEITPFLPEGYIAKRSLALMLLAGDESLKTSLSHKIERKALKKIEELSISLQSQYAHALSYVINQQRFNNVEKILTQVLKVEKVKEKTFASYLGHLSMHPIWGLPIVAVVLYLTYQIVGVFAAGRCVDFLENTVFGGYINPLAAKIVQFLIPVKIIQEVLIGEYGAISMALTYAVAIVLPIVGFFFIIFGLLEDSGYLPRLAVMVNRVFKIMGLNGKAVLPMILGLGCDTMATLTTRILPSKKERIITTLLLALAVPCSAQLGVLFGGTATISAKATLIWVGMIIGVIFFVGYLTSLILPGKGADFILEIPPLRIPKFSNILIKTLARLEWYLKEAVPLFILGTFILFLLQKSGLLGVIENIAAPIVVNLLNLPKEAAGAFVLGFLRRDYAAVLLIKSGNLSAIQMLVAIVTITLFVPCVANFFIIIKERGLKVAMLMVSFIFVFAFLVGGVFNYVLRFLKVTL